MKYKNWNNIATKSKILNINKIKNLINYMLLLEIKYHLLKLLFLFLILFK